MWRGHIFASSCTTDVFKNQNIGRARLITPGSDRNPKWFQAMSSLVEMRTRQNPLYKGGDTQIYPVPVRRDEW